MAKKNDININDLSTWPLVMGLVIAALIVAVLFYLLKTFLADDVSMEVDRKNRQIIEQENNYTRDKQIVAILPQIRKEVEELKKIQADLRKFLPTKISMPSLIENVYTVGRNNGIVFDELVPESYIEKEYYSIKPISLKAETGFESMASFIEEVTTLERIMNVDAVNFQVEGEAMQYKNANTPLPMTAQLRTYIFKDTLSENGKEGK